MPSNNRDLVKLRRIDAQLNFMQLGCRLAGSDEPYALPDGGSKQDAFSEVARCHHADPNELDSFSALW